MKRLTLQHMIFISALSLLMLLNLLMAAYKGPTSAQPVDFDAYQGTTIPDALIDGVIGNEWYDAEHRTDVLIDPTEIPSPYGRAEIWTKNDGTNLYIAVEFIADSNNPWVAIMPSPWPSQPTICIGYDLALFGDDNLDANGYVDAYFQSVIDILEDTNEGVRGIQNGAGAMKIGEGNLVTLELKKPLNSGDWRGSDIEWSVGETREFVIAWDSDGLGGGVGPGGSNGGNARHEGSSTVRNIFIDPERKVPLTLFASVTANSSTVNSGQTLNIAVQTTDGASPVSGANVTLSSDLGGSFSPFSGTSDPNGYFNALFTAPYVNASISPDGELARISANVSKDGFVDGSGYVDVLVLPSDVTPFVVAVASNPNFVRSGESSTITVNVTDNLSFNPVPEATVTLSSDSEGTFSPGTGNTDSNGIFTSTFTSPIVTQQTTITIKANVTKKKYSGFPNETKLFVQPSVVEGETELRWILVAGAAISIVVIAGVLIAKRERKDKIYEKMRKRYEEIVRGS